MKSRPMNIKPKTAIQLASPWAFWNFHDATIEGDTTLIVLENRASAYDAGSAPVTLADLNAQAVIGTQWSDFPNFYDFEGTGTDYWKMQMSQDYAMPNNFTPGSGAIFCWGRVLVNTGASTKCSIIGMGGGAATSIPFVEFQLQNVSSLYRLQIEYIADDGTSAITVGLNSGAYALNTLFDFAFLLDLRSGIHQLSGWVNGVSKGQTDLGADKTINYLDGAGVVKTANMYTTIGSRLTGASTVGNLMNGRLQRLGLINFGQNVPVDIDDIVEELYKNKSLPGWLLNGK